MKRLITAEVVAAEVAAGRRRISAPRGEAVITPEAWSRAQELGATFEQHEVAAPAPVAAPPPQGSAERKVDASGVVVVRGQSVRLADFPGAGPGKHVGLADLITGGDGSPMTAGLMSWGRDDGFDWQLDYAEIDLVLEGTLHLTIDGRTLEGRAGDVLYLPKGSKVHFGTPGRVRVFYVTYPANWADASSAPARPQK